MKKAYITPEVLVVGINVNNLMAGSGLERTNVGLEVKNNSEGVTSGNARGASFSGGDDWE